MAIDYQRMRQMAIRLITENGRDVTIREKVESAFDSVAGTVDVAYNDSPAMAVFVSITEANKPNNIVQDGDQWLFSTEEVNKDDLIVDSADGTAWQAVFVDEKFPGPFKLVWRVQVRS
jgi:hypothetical protein